MAVLALERELAHELVFSTPFARVIVEFRRMAVLSPAYASFMLVRIMVSIADDSNTIDIANFKEAFRATWILSVLDQQRFSSFDLFHDVAMNRA